MRFNGYVNFKAFRILKPFLYSHCISFEFSPCYLNVCSFFSLERERESMHLFSQ